MDQEEEQEFGQNADEPKKLTKWAKEPSVRDLKQDLDDAASDRDTHLLQVGTWLDNLNIEGKAKPTKVKGRSSVQPKLIRKQAEWRYASLSEPFLSTDDVFNVDPVTYEDKEAAKQNQLVINNQFNTKIKKVKFIDEYVRTCVDEGTVVVKLGWEFEEGERQVSVPKTVDVPINDPALAQELIRLGRPTVQQVPIGTKLEKKIVTIKNNPTLEVCNYRNLTIDPSCEGDLDKAQFIIYSFETSLAELKKDGRYSNLDNIVIESHSPLGDPDHVSKDNTSFNFKDKPRTKIIAYEYWGFRDVDGDSILTPIVGTWVGETMIRLEENPMPDKSLPFVSVQYLPVRKSSYGEPDGELLEDNQKIVGAVTRGMIDLMGRSANGQQGHRKDALDVTNRRKFNNGEDYEYNAQVDPRMAFHTHTFPEIPQSAIGMLNIQNSEAESLTGVKAFHNGISGEALGATATGVRSALDATAKRELGILRRLAEGLKQIGRKMISMNSEFLEDEEVIRITNEEFVPIRRDDLAGEFDLKLSISTAEADNEKAKGLEFMLQTTGNNLPPEITNMVLSEIADLRKMPKLAKEIKEYKPQPDPLAVKKAQLEISLLEAQIYNEQAKGQENAVDVQLKGAKTETEKAKARNLNSTSDKTDLDFLEQESGVSHNREIDKETTRTKGKLDEKAADSMLAQEGEQGFTPLPTV